MSAHVLLNLLNELGKRDKMRGLPSILSLFRNEFNKFNNTRARMLDTIYHMTNTLKFIVFMVYRFNCMALFHSQTRRHMIEDGNAYTGKSFCWHMGGLMLNKKFPDFTSLKHVI